MTIPSGNTQAQIAAVDAAYKASQGNNNSAYVATNGGTAKTLSTTQSQATSNTGRITAVSEITYDQLGNPISSTGPVVQAPTQPGVSAANDNNTPTAPVAEAQTTTGTSSFSQPITPQPNVLDNYSSYTYSLSLYLLTPQQATEIETLGIQNISTWQLLMQSGGINTNERYSLDPNNQIFSKDFYMDNLEIKSVISGRGTQSAHNATEMTWTVTEPNGLTLINNIYSAVVNLYKQAGIDDDPNYVNATYCMVIRFYGYDENGNLVQVGKQGTNGIVNKSDPTAVVTKFYPIRITNITFQLTNKQVEYKFEAVPVPYTINRGAFRATIPYNIELVGNTLTDIFVGKTGTAATTAATNAAGSGRTTTTQPVSIPSAPTNATNAPGPNTNNVFTGLCQALNAWQQDLVTKGIYQYPDTYSIKFASNDLANATVKKPGNTDYAATPMQQSQTASGQLNPATNSVESSGRTVPVTAGMQIVQFLEQQIRASSYISNQITYTTSEVTGKETPQTKNNQQPTRWYKINFVATPKQFDKKRRDHAYNITYIISPYAVNTMQSEYGTDGEFRGVHKSYKYWFTGLNTQILSYSQQINSLYAVVMTGTQSMNTQMVTGREQVPRVWMSASGQSSQGANNDANEPAANLADYQYSATDLATANLKIVGDPAWLQQDEAAGIISDTDFNFNPFNDDGTINFDASQVAFDIVWNTPADYNLQSGLVEVTATSTSAGTQNQNSNYATYLATEVKSHFYKGRFEQDLTGSLIPQQVTDNKMANNGTSSSASTTTDSGSTGTTGNSSTTAIAPLTAAAAANQLGLPNLGGLATNIGNAATSVANYIRNPLQNILPDGRINVPAPNASTTNPVVGTSDSVLLPANNANTSAVSNGQTITVTPPVGVQVYDAKTGNLVVTGSAVSPQPPQQIVKEP